MSVVLHNLKVRFLHGWTLSKIIAKAIADLFLFHCILFAVCSLIVFFIEAPVTGKSIENILSNLQNLSAAIFTMTSIWVAYSYKEAIGLYTKPSESVFVNKNDSDRIKSLVKVIITSACVLIGILIFNWCKAFLSGAVIYKDNLDLIKLLGVSFVLYLSFIQIVSIFSIIGASIEFVNDLVYKEAEAEAHRKL